ncbi:MAG: HAMP domain-containing protein [Candidatus Zixiibacteriota bacterium]|nr:MAG: HAMP domain-containing protein [candidate division Zixibacteria bacterium]
MNSPFGKKLLRLFLLFALVPAVIITAAGYYLASEETVTPRADAPARLEELRTYYNDYLGTRIDSSLSEFLTASGRSPEMLDFVLNVGDSTIAWCRPAVDTATFPVARILRTADSKAQGFVEWGEQYIQFRLREGPASGPVIGGIIHEADYARLLAAVQAERASITSQRTLAANYLYFLAIVFVAIAAITAALAWYFSSRFARNLASPLTELSAASQRIADGDFDTRVGAGGVGEVNTLIENFNRMAGQLRLTTSRLTQTERVAAWRSVARRFAHELRNPLQPILVALYRVDKLLKGTGEYDRVQGPLAAASEELRHLENLAERFSQLAKLPPPSLEPTDLGELLNSVAGLYGEQLSDFDFRLEIPASPCPVEIDATYFREAIHNLLKNAAEASSRGGTIVLSLAASDTRVAVEVQDFGCGMSPEEVSSARMPYFTTKEKGSGLGLAMVEKIAGELGGTMIIESRKGEGTTVRIDLPRRDNHG